MHSVALSSEAFADSGRLQPVTLTCRMCPTLKTVSMSLLQCSAPSARLITFVLSCH